MAYFPNWMALNKNALAKIKLANICLPATHDSGAYNLKVTPSSCIDHAYDARTYGTFVVGAAQATTRKISEQLNMGIRCFDFRVTYYAGDSDVSAGYYVYHDVLGGKFLSMVSDIADFLKANPGEVVYATVGHFCPQQKSYNYPGSLRLNPEDARQVDVFATVDLKWNRDFEQRLSADLRRSDRPGDEGRRHRLGSERTRLQKTRPVDETDFSAYQANAIKSGFWPTEYAPPDYGIVDPANTANIGGIYGSYMRTTELDAMLGDQQDKFGTAVANGLPFALYMTLTESTWMLIKGSRIGREHLLFDLSQKVDPYLTELVYQVIASAPSPSNKLPAKPGANLISILYADFFETTNLVNIAIDLTLGQAGAPAGYNWVGQNTPVTVTTSPIPSRTAVPRSRRWVRRCTGSSRPRPAAGI